MKKKKKSVDPFVLVYPKPGTHPVADGVFRRVWITRRLAVGFGSKQSTDPRLWRAMWGVQLEWWAPRERV
jgi:hypothetical protein